MSIEQKHKGYSIVYRDDIWTCHDLNVADAKLSVVIKRIDALGKSDRTVNVPALTYSHDWHGDKVRLVELTVTTLCEPEAASRWESEKQGKTIYCWTKNKKGERHKERIDQIIPLDARAELLAWAQADREAKAAQEKANKMLGDIPRHDVESLMLAAKEAAAAKKSAAE